MKSDRSSVPTSVERGLSLAAAAAGFLLLASLVMWGRDSAAPAANAWTRAIERVIELLGPLPVGLLSLGLVALGVRAFTSPQRLPIRSWGISLVGAVVGLSFVLGAVTSNSGGEFGSVFPRLLGPIAGGIAAFAFGLILLLSATWVALRSQVTTPAQNPIHSRPETDALTKTRNEDGVSAAEATALGHKAVALPIASVAASEVSEVRSRGGIPPGTRPLTPEHGHTQSQSPAAPAPAPRWAAQVDADAAQSARPDVADRAGDRVGSSAEADPSFGMYDGDEDAPVGRIDEPADGAQEPAAEPAPRVAPDRRTLTSAAPERILAPQVGVPKWERSTEAGTLELESTPPTIAPVRPSWEQESLFRRAEAEAESDAESGAAAEAVPPKDSSAARVEGFEWSGDALIAAPDRAGAGLEPSSVLEQSTLEHATLEQSALEQSAVAESAVELRTTAAESREPAEVHAEVPAPAAAVPIVELPAASVASALDDAAAANAPAADEELEAEKQRLEFEPAELEDRGEEGVEAAVDEGVEAEADEGRTVVPTAAAESDLKPVAVQQPTLFEIEEPELDPVASDANTSAAAPVAEAGAAPAIAAAVGAETSRAFDLSAAVPVVETTSPTESVAEEPAAEERAPEAIVLEAAPVPAAQVGSAGPVEIPSTLVAAGGASPKAPEEEPNVELIPAPRRASNRRRVVVEPEAQVEIVPEAPAVAANPVADPEAAATRRELSGREALVRDCGLLFIDRQRVAVSMLQRQFEMDFKQATEMLDELQQLGLIGPYMGGTRRDILMDRESWLSAVERS
jgi:hypothetical protein